MFWYVQIRLKLQPCTYEGAYDFESARCVRSIRRTRRSELTLGLIVIIVIGNHWAVRTSAAVATRPSRCTVYRFSTHKVQFFFTSSRSSRSEEEKTWKRISVATLLHVVETYSWCVVTLTIYKVQETRATSSLKAHTDTATTLHMQTGFIKLSKQWCTTNLYRS